MPVTRKFLDWNRPALPAVADFLLEQYTMLGVADLSRVVVVVPGRRAGRRLMELLIEASDAKLIRLTPPAIDTVGRLPERLYEPKRKFASDLINKFAWTAALRKVDEDDIRSIIPDPPKDRDISRWLSFGELLWRQHRELAAEGLDFQDVITRGAEVASFDETERWQILRRVQESCLLMLDDLELWDLQSARLFAVKHHECHADFDIVLVGTADLNLSMRDMLRQVSDRVTALIHAPQRLSRRFDEFGCISPDAWRNVQVELQAEQIEVVEGPADQATSIVETLIGYDGRFRMDEVTIGITDERLVPEIDRHLVECDVQSRWVVGQKLNESRPYKLLGAVAEYLETGRYASFAALIRQIDLDRWLFRQPADVSPDEDDVFEELHSTATSDSTPAWLKQLDEYFNRHLPSEPGDWIESERHTDRIQHVHACLTALLTPLAAKDAPLGDWVRPLTDLLMNVYSDVEFDLETEHDAYTISACRQIYELLLTHANIPPVLMPRVGAAQAIRLLLNELSADSVPPLPNDDAVELLGWLELPLDDSPAMVVTSFNEGYVPSSLNSDAFLPNTLRRHLGLLDNRRRYARDAYALTVLVKSRRDLKLIVGRRDMRGDPLRPSRLLFAADPSQIAERVQLCFQSAEAEAAHFENVVFDDSRERSESGFTVPRPLPLHRPIDRISVTSFRTYLACPYRFYLRHVLRIKDIDDAANELDALMFGNLMHEVLNRFGTGPQRNSTNAKEIKDNLRQLLADCVQEMLGDSRLAAVNVQIMQLQWRLDAFADWQARWAAYGWRIIHSEANFRDKDVRLDLGNGQSVQLDGRIDRIDQLSNSNEYIIFDYKSSENVKTPKQAHIRKGEWIDLQLPLYRHLAQRIGLNGNIKLGYIVLPKDTKKVQHLMAEWTEEDFAHADKTAIDVAKKIVGEEFWPPSPDVNPMYFPEFAAICQDGVFDREVLA